MELGFSIEMEVSGRAFATWYYVELGGLWWTNVLNSALPPQRHSPDTQLEHQDPVSLMAFSFYFTQLLGFSFGFVPASVCRSPEGICSSLTQYRVKVAVD